MLWQEQCLQKKINRVDSKATLGIFIGRSEYRSKGYGAEAINLILDFGFNYMNLNSINLTVLDCNERAKACYKKCGFKETGRERQGKFVNGKYILNHDSWNNDISSFLIKENAVRHINA